MKYNIGDKLCISLHALFVSYCKSKEHNNNDYVQAAHGQVVYTTDGEPEGYYDFYDENGLECSDGEVVVIDDIENHEADNQSIVMHSASAGTSEYFVLDEDEFDKCCTLIR